MPETSSKNRTTREHRTRKTKHFHDTEKKLPLFRRGMLLCELFLRPLIDNDLHIIKLCCLEALL